MSDVEDFVEPYSETPQTILDFTGFYFIELFYFHLFKKYKSSCAIWNPPDGLGITIDFDRLPFILPLESFASQFLECYERLKQSGEPFLIMIPIFIAFKQDNHANLLVFRNFNGNNIFEHFEPMGYIEPIKISNVKNVLIAYIESLQIPYVFHDSNITCPNGLQYIESQLPSTETEGYCLAWCMFFTELCLHFPNYSSKELNNIVLKYAFTSEDARRLLKNVIQNYVHNIENNLQKYYNIIFKPFLTEDKPRLLGKIFKEFTPEITLKMNEIVNKLMLLEKEMIVENMIIFADDEYHHVELQTQHHRLTYRLQQIQSDISSFLRLLQDTHLELFITSEDTLIIQQNEILSKMKGLIDYVNNSTEPDEMFDRFVVQFKQWENEHRTLTDAIGTKQKLKALTKLHTTIGGKTKKRRRRHKRKLTRKTNT